MTDKFAGQVPLPETGAGNYLQVRLAAMAELETEFGEFVFVDRLLFGLPRCSPKCLGAFLKNCVFDKNGNHIEAEWPVDEPFERLAEKALDALSLAVRGMTHEEWVKSVSEAVAGENPTDGTAA